MFYRGLIAKLLYYDKLDSTMLEYQRLKEVNDLPLAVRAGTQKWSWQSK
jgi:hypothetical protein